MIQLSGIISSQIKKYAGYMPGGFQGNANDAIYNGDPDLRVGPATNINSTEYSKILFVSETTSASTATLNVGSRAPAGYSNPAVAGYTLGGESPAGDVVYSKIEKLTFVGETNSTISATLSGGAFAFTGANNTNVAGYTFGGFGASVLNTINKLTFSNDTNTAIAATLPVGRHNTQTCYNGSTAIYNAGGIPSNNTITKLTLSNETMSTLGATLLSSSTHQKNALSNSGTCGYIVYTGTNSTNFSGISNKLTYSNETISQINLVNSFFALWPAGVNYGNIAGYLMGGLWQPTTSNNVSRKISKLSYSTESHTLLSSVMTQFKRQSQGFSYVY